MIDFLQNLTLFYAALIAVLFVPGYFLILAVFGKDKIISALERFVISFGLSIVSVNFIYFALDGMKIPLTRLSTLAGIFLFSAVCFGTYKLRGNKNPLDRKDVFIFSKNQVIIIFLLIFLAFFIKTAFLAQTISPNSTDLGHHMYWARWLVENQQLPTYDGMPDFIIGEHTIFGAIGLLSGLSFFSAFPPLVLHLINLLSILAVFILTLRIFKEKDIAILSLLFLGVLFAITAPQSKFVTGGVVGNLIGNFLMPLAFYFYCRAFDFLSEEKASFKQENKIFLSLAIFTTFGLFYTHHLTALIFLFVFAFLAVAFLLFNYKRSRNILAKTVKLFFSPQAIAAIILGLIFFFFIFTPNYVKKSAVDTAVGAPTKTTREGLTLADLNSAVGGARLALGFAGLASLLFLRKNRNFGYFLAASWGIMIFLLSTAPHLLFINLPSNRIGNYLSYPLAVLSAVGFYFIFRTNKKNSDWKNNPLIKAAFLFILGFALIEGVSDSAASIPIQKDYAELVQTFDAAGYLNGKIGPGDKILKDHNYIAGDSWIKLFFMRGYKYPDSRGYFKRYEDPTKPREMCTLWMISNPGGEDAKKCFDELQTNFVMVNPQFDSGQFRKLKNFDQVYMNPTIAIYYKKK